MLTIKFPLQMPPPRIICNSNKNTLQKAHLGVDERWRKIDGVRKTFNIDSGIIKLLDSVISQWEDLMGLF